MALSLLIDGVERVGYLLDKSLQVTITAGARKGRCDFTLVNFKPDLQSVVIADGAMTYFDGTAYSCRYTEWKVNSFRTDVVGHDAGPAATEAMAPFMLADQDQDTMYTAANAASPPLCWWRLGEAAGATATDEMGVQDATYIGSPTLGVAGAWGVDTAVTLDGSTQWLTAGAANLRGRASISIAAWFKTSASAANQIIYAERSTLAHALIRLYINTAGRPVFQWRDDAATLDTVTVASGDWSDGAWHHVVVTKAGTAVAIYVDGVSVKTEILTATDTQTSVMTANIGRDPNAADQWFAGSLDEVMIFDYELDAGEIADGVGSAVRRLYHTRDVRPYRSLEITRYYDIAAVPDTPQSAIVRTFDAGLAPGQILAVSSQNLGAYEEFIIQEVRITWLRPDMPEFTITATSGVDPIRLADAFA